MNIRLWLVSLIALVLLGLTPGSSAVYAAKEAPPAVTACVVVATAGDISVFRCEDYDRGIEFYLNSFGFMLAAE